MQRPTTRHTARAFWPMVAVFALLVVEFALVGGDARRAGTAMGEQTIDLLVGALEHPLLTLGVLAAGAGALVYRSRGVLLGR